MMDERRRETLLDAIQRGDEIAQLMQSEAVRDFFVDKENEIIDRMSDNVNNSQDANFEAHQLVVLRALKKELHATITGGIYAQETFNRLDEQEANDGR